MRDVVGELRSRLEQSRQTNASLETWRELQLEILTAARELQRKMWEAAARNIAVRDQLWVLLGESFWIERSVDRLVPMVERVLAALEAAASADEA